MPFNFRETVGAINHLRLRWERDLFKRPADLYLRNLETPSSLRQLVSIAEPAEQDALCAICGFRVAKLKIAGGWTLETCSATGAGELLKSSNLRKWLLGMPGFADVSASLEQTTAKLPESVI
jgi:hypothetical protein